MALPPRTRHLLTFSYIGSFFKASTRTSKEADLTTVIGSLELACQVKLKKLGIEDPSPLVISSRTDGKVHALQNTAHIDFTPVKHWYNPNNFVSTLNIYFLKRKIPLRISSIQQVSNNFSARRWAQQRSYLYRIGVPKPNGDNNSDIAIPISEVNRCHFLSVSDFNLDAVEELLSIFPGVHNFCSFSGAPKKTLALRSPIRQVDTFCIRRGKPLMTPLYEPSTNSFDYWDFIVEGRSFLYNQVRRMVSAAIAVAQGRSRVADVKRALESSTPHQLLFPIVPPHGLYLTKVTYKKEDLLVNRPTRLIRQEYSTLVNLLDQHRLLLKN